MHSAPVAAAESHYIIVRGLPFSGSERDVVQLFNGFAIPAGGLTMCLNHAGRFNGEAIIRFATIEEATRALERNGAQVRAAPPGAGEMGGWVRRRCWRALIRPGAGSPAVR